MLMLHITVLAIECPIVTTMLMLLVSLVSDCSKYSALHNTLLKMPAYLLRSLLVLSFCFLFWQRMQQHNEMHIKRFVDWKFFCSVAAATVAS